MDFGTATEFVKAWTPWIAVGGFVWSAYRKALSRITKWAGTLMDNHARHAQESLDRIEATQTGVLTALKEQTTLLKKIAEK